MPQERTYMSKENPTAIPMAESSGAFVQTCRDKAREILLSRLLNHVLQDKFYAEKDVTSCEENVAAREKCIKQAVYDISKIDDNNPSAEDIRKHTESRKQICQKDLKYANRLLEEAKERREEINKQITRVINGEIKVSIEEVKQLSDKMIMESYKG